MSADLPPGEAAALLHRIAEAGDRQAFATLFGHFAPRLKSYLMRLDLPPARAEELAQETMLTVWRRAAQFDPATTGVSGWIFTIARNLRVDSARRDKLADRLEPEDMEPPAAPDAETVLEHSQRGDRLREALSSLPKEQAQVLHLAYFDERPHAEIEQKLGIPLGTVKSRLRLAMNRLRTLLDDMR